ncbi:iron-sulfur cluster biosynthesis family protein [uncultured Limosilactobacillus sp.]|uniref:iron-sulfur cluster biosynthesis family protein n=1 Tax=uncultured Limosilactobacillus sp. TaxID=2837629 RepID=UPI0025E9FBFF|nr:iron-sulfur cluster biosynthesis family protein [uncultured Limosilactobacillus sp.]
MFLTFTEEAKQRLSHYLNDSKKMLLDYDDGVGPFSALGNCSLDDNFKLIFVNRNQSFKDFNASFDSNLGKIYYKGYTKPQFADQMTVSFNSHVFTMPLKSPQGVLTDDIEVLDVSNADLQQTKMTHAHDC